MAVVIRLPDDAVQTILDRLEVDGINSGIGHTSPTIVERAFAREH